MNTRNLSTRILSMMLVLVMVFGMVPMQVFAAETAQPMDAAIVFTDLHTNSSNYKESTVKGVMTAMKNSGLPFSTVTCGGDAFSSNQSVSTGYTDTITGYIQSALGTNIPVNYVWSDHDRGAYNNATEKVALDKTSHMTYGAGNDGVYGTADDGNYYIFSLSMADLSTDDRYNSGFHSNAQVTQAIADFLAVAKTLDQSKPLFVVSHMPLFERRSDNGHALEWFQAINEVATTMDVAYFFGHNHSHDQAGDYYFAKGSTMTVETTSGTGSKQTLNFTHIGAGYLSPANNSSTTRSGTAIAIAIYDDSIRYTTYNSSGVYTGSYAVDEVVTRAFASAEPELVVSGTDAYFVGSELELTVLEKVGSKTTDVTALAEISGFDMNTAGDYTVHISYGDLHADFPIIVREKTFRDDATGITAEVSVPGATGMTVAALDTDSAAFQAVAPLMRHASGYSITMDNCTEATLTLPIPAGVTTPAVFHVSEDDQTVTRIAATVGNGTVSFTTGSFGAYVIGQQVIDEDLESSLVAGGTAYEEDTVYVRVDAFEDGGKYLVIGESKYSSGSPLAYVNNNGSESSANVTINSGSITAGGTTYTKGYIELDNTGAVWTASGSSSSGYTLTNGGYYIGGTDANTLKNSASSAVKMTYDSSASRLKTASGTTRYLYYSPRSSENWKWSTSSSSSSSSGSKNMWIYKEVTIQTLVSTPVTYTIEAENVHHVLTTDTLQLNHSLLANGAAAELPQGADFSFEVKNDTNDIIKSISDTGLITFTKAEGDCFVKIACTWNEGTCYKYVRVTTERDPNACDHSYESVTVEPTCTEDGAVIYTCHCGDTYAEVIEALGHSYTSVILDPTCIAEGYTVHTCTICGHRYTSDHVAALGHDYESVTVEPTCTEAGSVTYTCHCGEYHVEILEALGHEYNAVVTAPTCTEEGYTTYTCHCGDSYTADETAALGHSYESVTVEATCTKDGSITYTCHCGDTYAEVIEATGHDYNAVVTEPTCTDDGYTTYTCACGDTYTADETAALGHNYNAVITAPTCTEAGCTTYTCACGDTYTADVIEALGHSYESVTVEATCTENGSVTYTCACGDTYAEVIEATGHDYTSVVTEPTCTEDGYTTYTCACGNTHTADQVAALGHDYVCTEDGDTLVYTCTCCGHAYTEVIARQWVKVSGAYVLDTDGIDVGSEHKYIVVGATKDYALTLSGDKIGATKVTIQGNILTMTNASKSEFYFHNNSSKEANTYLLTQDGSKGVYHVTGEIKYGHDSKGYWYFGSGSNGTYQLYDRDGSNWYLNYGYVWSNQSVSRFAVSSTARSLRLYQYTNTYARLAGSLAQTCTDADNLTIEDILTKLSIETSVNGADVNGTIAVTADMITWDSAFDSTTPGVYIAEVSYQGIQLGTIQVTVTAKHSYRTEVIAPTCTEDGCTVHTCTICGFTKTEDHTEALGHNYECEKSGNYLIYTCKNCGDTYSEQAAIYGKVSSIASGKSYVITMYSGSKYYALSHANNTLTAVEITVSNNEITSEVTEDLLWNYKDNKLGYEDNGTTYRLYGKKAGPKSGTLSISDTSSSSVSFKNSKLKIDTQYLRYNNDQIALNSSATTTYMFAVK